MFENKKRKKEREALEKRGIGSTPSKEIKLKEGFYKTVDRKTKLHNDWSDLVMSAIPLLDPLWKVAFEVNVYDEYIEVHFRNKKDIPDSIFCDASNIGLMAILEEYYTGSLGWSIYDKDEITTKYKIKLELKR